VLTHRDLLLGLGLPGLVGTVLFLLARVTPTRGAAAERIVRDASPFALVLGYLTAVNVLLGRPAFPPTEAPQLLFFALLALGLLSAVYECRASGVWHYYVPIAIAVVLLPTIWLLVRPLAAHRWSGEETAAWIVGLSVAAAGMTMALDRLLDRQTGPAASMSLVLVVALTAIVLLLSGTKTDAQLSAAAAAAIAPGAALAAAGRARPFSRLIAPSFVLLWGGLLLAGHLYASLTSASALLLLLAPLGLWLGELPAVARWPNWRRGLLGLAAAGLPASVAAGLAVRQFLEDTATGY
jgi:uncharacterized membrane protein YhaH (DUF805 family)